MKPTENPAAPGSGSPVRCDVAAFGSVQFTHDMFPALRQKPGPGLGQSLPNNFLKHADEQTVAGLAAVLQAVDRFGLGTSAFRDWGVVAAPAFLGRVTLANAQKRYADEGAWGISPHFIPHSSQHAAAGTISQALKIHGPNFGTGGSPVGAVEALLAGAVLLEGNQLPGIWAVISGWEPELVPDRDGTRTADCVCKAVAFALVAAGSGRLGLSFAVRPVRELEVINECANGICHPSAPSFETLQKALTGFRTIRSKLSWQLNAAVIIELQIGLPELESQAAAIGQRPVGRIGPFEQAGAGTENKR